MSEDLIVASTTDSEQDIQAALTHGLEVPAGVPVLSTEDETPAVAEPPVATTPVDEDPEGGEGAPEGQDAVLAKKPTKAEKRIAQLVREREDEKRAREDEKRGRERAEQELAALRAAHEVARPAPPAVAEPAARTEPKAEDFETHESWLAALSKWNAEEVVRVEVAKALDAERQRVAAQQVEDTRRETLREFATKREVAAETYDDFHAVIKEAAEMPISAQTEIMMVESPEIGSYAAYYLATHRDEARELFELQGTAEEGFAIGELRAKARALMLEARKTQEPAATSPPPATASTTLGAAGRRQVSRAPEPITPLGARTTATTVPDDQLAYREYKAKRDAQDLARRKYRR